MRQQYWGCVCLEASDSLGLASLTNHINSLQEANNLTTLNIMLSNTYHAHSDWHRQRLEFFIQSHKHPW
jgi:hypothetical protein